MIPHLINATNAFGKGGVLLQVTQIRARPPSGQHRVCSLMAYRCRCKVTTLKMLLGNIQRYSWLHFSHGRVTTPSLTSAFIAFRMMPGRR